MSQTDCLAILDKLYVLKLGLYLDLIVGLDTTHLLIPTRLHMDKIGSIALDNMTTKPDKSTVYKGN